jgi:quinol monooxygenase YgiN
MKFSTTFARTPGRPIASSFPAMTVCPGTLTPYAGLPKGEVINIGHPVERQLMAGAFNVVARYRTLEGKTEEVLTHLHEMAAASRKEPGNITYEFFRGLQDDRQIVILESYGTADDFEAHRNSEHFQKIGAGQILPLLESRTVATYRTNS